MICTFIMAWQIRKSKETFIYFGKGGILILLKKWRNHNMYDVIIIGSGPAGLSAAIYAGRAKFDTLIIEEKPMIVTR